MQNGRADSLLELRVARSFDFEFFILHYSLIIETQASPRLDEQKNEITGKSFA